MIGDGFAPLLGKKLSGTADTCQKECQDVSFLHTTVMHSNDIKNGITDPSPKISFHTYP